MKTLNESLKMLDENYLEALKSIGRNFNVNLEMLEISKFDPILYGEAIVVEDSINAFEVKLKEDAIVTIAKFQPAAKNLRELVMLMNSARVLERMGDLLKANLIFIKDIEKENSSFTPYLKDRILPVAKKIKHIFDLYVEAFVNNDVKLLYNILYLDEEVDSDFEENCAFFISKVKENSDCISAFSSLMFLNVKFERVSDHIIHLANDLIYIINGENIRKKELDATLDK